MQKSPRKHKRLSKRFPIRFGIDRPSILGFVKNISLGGLCISSKTVYHAKSKILMEMQVDTKTLNFTGEVRWVSRPDRMAHMSGLKSDMGILIHNPPDDYVDFVLNSFDSFDNKRKNQRFQKSFKVIFDNPEELLSKYTQDISQGGVFIVSDESPAFDTELELKMVVAETMTVVHVWGRVVHVVTKEMAEEHGLNAGFGIQFSQFEGEDEEKLKKYVDSLRSPYDEE